jgi:hypothetical protein
MLGCARVVGDAADDRRIGNLLRVARLLDRRAQPIPDEREAQAEKEAEPQTERDVAVGPGAERNRIDRSLAHQGGLDRAGLVGRHPLELVDRGRELLAEGVGVAACWALASLTVTSMRTVSSGTVAATLAASSSAVVASLSLSITGSSTLGVSRSWAYDLTRCWVKALPCRREPLLSAPEVAMKDWV